MISVLTLVKNRERHLRNLVEGLRRSSTAPAELVIVDMSDTPIDHPVTKFPVRIVRLATDGLPLAQARNLAAANASSKSLLFLDVDCIPSEGLISGMAKALADRDALICAEILYLKSDDMADGRWTDASLRVAGVSHPARKFPRSGLLAEANRGLFWSLTFGISASAFQRVAGFDENFTGYGGEDTDFSLRAKDAGLELLFLGGACAYHQYHGVFDPPLQHFEDIIRNARNFHEKWRVWPMLGWLDAFASLGLLVREGHSLSVIRQPTDQELREARRPCNQPF